MTPEAQQIAIETAAGWSYVAVLADGSRVGTAPFDSMMDDRQVKIPVPDYLGDLNAMNAAEKTLNNKAQEEYCDVLCDMLAADDLDPPVKLLLFATAAQRAEAFLRTLGLWREI